MKKLLSALLALCMLGQTVFAANLYDFVNSNLSDFVVDGMFDYTQLGGTVETTVDATASVADAGNYYSTTSLNPISSSLGKFDYKVSIEMSPVLSKFNSLYATTLLVIGEEGGADAADLEAQFKASKVSGNFTVKVTYDANLSRGTSELVFGQEGVSETDCIFEVVTPINYSTNPFYVNFTIKDGVTVQDLKDTPALLNNLYMTLDDVTATKNQALPVTVQLTAGDVILTDLLGDGVGDNDVDYGKISFATEAASVYVKKTSSGGGGGSTSSDPRAYTVIDNKSKEITVVKADGKIYVDTTTIEVPQKDGLAFDGWFLDAELTKPVSGTFEIKETTYLYPKFTKVDDIKASVVIDGVEKEVPAIAEDGKLYIDTDAIEVPEKDGFAFDGWYTEPYMYTEVDGKLEITENTKLYPKFINLVAPAELIADDHFAYIVGYPDGEVKPNGKITREEVAAAFYRLLTADKKAEIEATTHTFPDVEATRWSNDSIATLAKGGYIVGDENGNFNPSAPITRAEFVTIASKFMADNTDAGINYFTDIDGHWAKDAIVKVASQSYWIFGYEDGTFKPNNNITRAEAMAIINRMLVRYGDTDSSHAKDWPDVNEADWFYGPVIEATTSHDDFAREADGWNENWHPEQ